MSTTATNVPEQHASYDPGYGWVLFAAVLLMLLATVNLIEGLAAISNSHFFVRGAHDVAGSLNTWGWFVTIIGTCEFIAGFFVLTKNQIARWAAVILLALSTVVQLLMMPADPFFSLVVLAVNIVAIYGLIVHGAIHAPDQRAG